MYRNGTDGYRDGQPVDPKTGVYGSPAPGSLAAAAFEPARFLSGDELVTKSVAGAVLGVPAQDVPDIATLLFGPLARGTTVSLR